MSIGSKDELVSLAVSADEKGEEPLDMVEAIDLHSQTDFSDGLQKIEGVISEAYEKAYLKGKSDHANVGNESKNYSSSFFRQNEDIGGNDPAFSEVYSDSYEALSENIDDVNGVILWENADLDKVAEDIGLLRRYEGEYSLQELRSVGALNYDMVVVNAVELDFNPIIEDKENAWQEYREAKEYKDSIFDFLDEAEEKGEAFNHVNQAVHDVYINGELRYVKRPELFTDLSIEEKKEVWYQYRKKLRLVTNYLAPKLNNKRVTVSAAHPALPERNDELMEVFRKPKAREEVESFMFDNATIPGSINNVPGEQVPDVDIDELVSDEEISKLYPEESLREYWRPYAEDLAEAKDVIIPEVGGKHAERFHPSVLWSLYETYIPGSDQHREGEYPLRNRMISELDLSADLKAPTDLIKTETDESENQIIPSTD